MQIREQGQRIQLIRAKYCPDIKRARQEVVATLPRYGAGRDIPAEIRKLLSAEEAAQVEAWLLKREEAAHNRALAAAVAVGPVNLQRIAEGLAAGCGSSRDVAAIEAAITSLRKHLRARKRRDQRSLSAS